MVLLTPKKDLSHNRSVLPDLQKYSEEIIRDKLKLQSCVHFDQVVF